MNLICFVPAGVSESKLRIPYSAVATTGMIGDMVKAVAGDRATVKTLISAGVDPHLYKPTRSDIATLHKADVTFFNGLLLEGKMTEALARVAASGRRVLAVADAIPPTKLLEPGDFAGHFDPHLWMDPLLWSQTVNRVAEELSQLDPAGKRGYLSRAKYYRKQLHHLHAYSSRLLEQVVPETRVLVTAHDAFHYFGQRYGFEVLGIQGISTESEAGVRDIQKLVETLVTRKISAVFVESTVSDRSVKALIEGAAARNHTVTIGGELFSDAMGQANTYEGTYPGMIAHNVETIATAFGVTIPDGGFRQFLIRELQ